MLVADWLATQQRRTMVGSLNASLCFIVRSQGRHRLPSTCDLPLAVSDVAVSLPSSWRHHDFGVLCLCLSFVRCVFVLLCELGAAKIIAMYVGFC